MLHDNTEFKVAAFKRLGASRRVWRGPLVKRVLDLQRELKCCSCGGNRTTNYLGSVVFCLSYKKVMDIREVPVEEEEVV